MEPSSATALYYRALTEPEPGSSIAISSTIGINSIGRTTDTVDTIDAVVPVVLLFSREGELNDRRRVCDLQPEGRGR